MDHCLLLGLWALEYIMCLGFQPCKLWPWPQTCLDGNQHPQDLSNHHEDACPTGGCSVEESTALCKARGICWGGGWHLDLGGLQVSPGCFGLREQAQRATAPCYTTRPSNTQGSFAVG